MNKLCATGNLGKDAEVKRTASGVPVCAFSVAMKAGWGDKAQTVWLDCSLWGKQAESALPQYLKKGQQVAVTGELSTFEATSGKTYLKLRCDSVDLVGGKPEGGQAKPAPATQQQAPSADEFDDDIPF